MPVSQLRDFPLFRRRPGSGAGPHPGLGAVGKAKKKAAEQARDTAAELLALYAARAARQGHAFAFKEHDYEAFADGFAFEETADQAQAIAAVIADMRTGKPWTAWSAATSASARPRWRSVPPSAPWPAASKSPCSARRRCSASSTTRPSPIALPTGR